MVNLLELLLDLGILNQSWHGDVPKVPTTSLHNISPEYLVHLSYSKPMSAHALTMSSVIRQVFLIDNSMKSKELNVFELFLI